jgi:hypothetical protein
MTNASDVATPVITPETYLWEPTAKAIEQSLVPIEQAEHLDLIGLNIEFRGGQEHFSYYPIKHAVLADHSVAKHYRYGAYHQLGKAKAAKMAHLTMMIQSDPNVQALFEPIARAMAMAEDPTVPEFPYAEAHIFRDGILFGPSSNATPPAATPQAGIYEPEVLPADLCLITQPAESNHDAMRKQKKLNDIISVWNATQTHRTGG